MVLYMISPTKYNPNILSYPVKGINQMLVSLQTLRVPLVSSLASAPTRTSSRASPALTTTLTVLRNGTATRSARRSNGNTGASWRSGAAATEFAVDEGQCLLPVHGSVALMRICVVTVAAVWVRGITIALDLACGWTLEARWAGGKL